MNKKWISKQIDSATAVRLSAQLGISPMLGKLIAGRGITTPEEAQTYLYPTIADLHDPFLLSGMSRAVDRIHEVIASNEPIWIYGDYDTDGTTSTSLLINTFKHLDCEVNYYIPDRFEDGYGLTNQAISKIAEQKGDQRGLLITVDCGVTSIGEVDFANENGFEVIITDHHEPPPDRLPNAYAIVNPKMSNCENPFEGLAGIGLAFKLAHALIGGEDLSPFLQSQLDLVALGTVVDVVPLVGENRTLSRLGLDQLRKLERVGIRELWKIASGRKNSKISGGDLGFKLGPRINAAGRMAKADKIIELLTTDSDEIARRIAHEIDAHNVERQTVQSQMEREAIAIIERRKLNKKYGIVVAREDWHRGITGIVAGRIKERYHRPTFCIAIDGEIGTASGRAIDGIDLADCLNSCKDLFIKHGGHVAAAGFSIEVDKIPEFEKHFENYARDHLSPEDLEPKLIYDFEIPLEVLTLDAIEALDLLEPFGRENEAPLLRVRNAEVKGSPRTVSNGKHLKFSVANGNRSIEAIAFGKSDYKTPLRNPNARIDLVFEPQINEWQGKRTPQMNVKEIEITLEERASQNRDLYPSNYTDAIFKLVDRRGVARKENYIMKVLDRDEASIVYVRDDSSIDQLIELVRRSGRQGIQIGRCDSETTNSKKQILAEMLAEERIRGVIASETLEYLPRIEHIVFCHPLPIREEFFKRCNPVLHLDLTTYIHLIYNEIDFETQKKLLNQKYPNRETLVKIYKELQNLAHGDPQKFVELAQLIPKVQSNECTEFTIVKALTIFEELGFILQHNHTPEIEVVSVPKRELGESEVYRQGEAIKIYSSEFALFLRKDLESMWREINNACRGTNQTDQEL